MQMPSLFKYFAVVGSVLFGLLAMVNHLLAPEETGKAQVSAPPQVVVVRHDPRASVMERWRNEQAALKAATQAQTSPNASLVIKSEIAPPPQPVSSEQPATAAAPAEPIRTQPAALAQDDHEAAQAEAARAAKLADARAKAARAKARKAKLARERELAAHTNEFAPSGSFSGAARNASSQQDHYYYGQRAGGVRPAQGPGYAYAPQQSFGPFGWGRGW